MCENFRYICVCGLEKSGMYWWSKLMDMRNSLSITKKSQNKIDITTKITAIMEDQKQ